MSATRKPPSSQREWWTPERRARHSQILREVLKSPERRKAISEAAKARHLDNPDLSKQIGDKIRATWADPTRREEMMNSRRHYSSNMKNLWNDPEWRAKQKAAMRMTRDGRLRVDRYGYVVIRTNDGRDVHQHRHVMSERLGRPLLRSEHVHHKNGNRADNRPDNLELWNKSHPPGQRAVDLLAWAKEIIALYDGKLPETA